MQSFSNTLTEYKTTKPAGEIPRRNNNTVFIVPELVLGDDDKVDYVNDEDNDDESVERDIRTCRVLVL
jgi:hypothetical protein